MYMKPSSTSGVASRLSSFEVPPSATANKSFRSLTLVLLIDGERGEALGAVVVMMREPVLRLRIEEALVSGLSGAARHGGGEQKEDGDDGAVDGMIVIEQRSHGFVLPWYLLMPSSAERGSDTAPMPLQLIS